MIPIAKPIIGDAERKAVLDVLNSGMLVQGPKVKEFEERFAAYCGAKHAVAMSNGTAALHTALCGAGVKPGDEVITTPFTFVATANAVLMSGARGVFAAVDEDTFNINTAEVERKLTPKTAALLPVDLYGLPADYAELKALIMHHNHNIKIVADSCQAIGAHYDGEPVGSLGDVSAFSLYATKNIMCGEGGVVTTNNDAYAEYMRKFRHHGQNTQYSYDFLGYNYRLTDLQAAIAVEQLKNADAWTKKRKENAKLMSELLADVYGITLPVVPAHSTHVFHQYTLRVRNGRNKLAAYLTEHGVGCKVFYPTPLHLEAHLRADYKPGDFPVAEKLCGQVLSVPIHPLVTLEDVAVIAKTVKEGMKRIL